jgi:NAD+ kinase
MRRIYVIANPKRKPGVTAVLKEVLPWLRRIATVVKVDNGGEGDLNRINADLVLVFGGDGSILAAARRLRGNPVPVFGVNLGHLGFLAEITTADLRRTLPRILRGDYVLSPRMMLLALVPVMTSRGSASRSRSHGGRKLGMREYVVLNDAVILRRPNETMISVDVRVSGEPIARYKGDGLIVSTATGSTGYSLSAGGPILSERLKALIVTPICPHTLANRPIVLSGEETLDVCAESRSGAAVELIFDGQVSCPLPSGAVVTIGRAPYEFNLITVGKKGRYEIIRDKLHWAGWVKER